MLSFVLIENRQAFVAKVARRGLKQGIGQRARVGFVTRFDKAELAKGARAGGIALSRQRTSNRGGLAGAIGADRRFSDGGRHGRGRRLARAQWGFIAAINQDDLKPRNV